MPTEQYSKGGWGGKTHLKANQPERFGDEYIAQTKRIEKKDKSSFWFSRNQSHSNFWPGLVTGEGDHLPVNSDQR